MKGATRVQAGGAASWLMQRQRYLDGMRCASRSPRDHQIGGLWGTSSIVVVVHRAAATTRSSQEKHPDHRDDAGRYRAFQEFPV